MSENIPQLERRGIAVARAARILLALIIGSLVGKIAYDNDISRQCSATIVECNIDMVDVWMAASVVTVFFSFIAYLVIELIRGKLG